MALRLARAFTGREKLVRVRGHFHGWHDHMTSGHTNHFDGSPTIGVLDGVADNVLLVDANDSEGLARLFDAHRDIAAAIVEPTGANFGRIPIDRNFLVAARELTRASGALLIFDEVVTGFRVSPGGAQAVLGIVPDLTALAKILAGGLPGGAVAGRKDVLDQLDFAVTRAAGKEKIAHPGTFNANPLSAAAGVATLEIIAASNACARANAYGATLRARLNEVLEEERVKWAVHGSYSGFHIFTNPQNADIAPNNFDPAAFAAVMLASVRGQGIASQLRMGLLVNGVDVNTGPAGTISATHGAEEMAATVDALRSTVRALRREGALA
jgi:glutamate-1-semialdehyde 2,1-aminomutase